MSGDLPGVVLVVVAHEPLLVLALRLMESCSPRKPGEVKPKAGFKISSRYGTVSSLLDFLCKTQGLAQ